MKLKQATLKTRSGFFESIFSETKGNIELRAFHKTSQSSIGRLFSTDLVEVNNFVERYKDKGNIYVGVCTRKLTSQSGTKSDCLEISGYWCDLDFKDYPGGETEARKILESFPHKPSMLIHTGGGLHGYWLFKEPDLIGTDCADHEAMLRGIKTALNGDSCTDISRILRVPGTTNYPNEKKLKSGRTGPLPSEIEYINELRYTSLDFQDFLEPSQSIEASKSSTVIKAEAYETINKTFEEDLRKNATLNNTWLGNRTNLTDSTRSGFDMSLASQLALMGYSRQETKAILKQSPSGKNSTGSNAYFDHTINKAFSGNEKNKNLKESTFGNKTKIADQVTKALRDNPNVELFHDQLEEPYAACRKDDTLKCFPLRSRNFRRFVGFEIYKSLSHSLSKDATDQVISNLEAVALYEGQKRSLEVRVAREDNNLWYDLGKGAVRINEDGWAIENDVPILFKTFVGMENQVVPKRGGNIHEIFNFLNITDEDSKLLFLTFMISAFVPEIPHPILAIHGPKGSAKSTLLRLLLRLIDPSIVIDVPMSNLKEFAQSVSHRWAIPLDNVSKISKDFSDFLCKLVTGTAYVQRELYSNDDDIIRRYRRVILLNGINLPVEKPDLLDRTIIIELDQIKERVTEKDFEEKFERKLPYILGACFDLLSTAMRKYPSINPEKLPRLADYGQWAIAITMALGRKEADFVEAYDRNVEIQCIESLDASPLARVIEHYFESHDSISGTPTEVFDLLRTEAQLPEVGIDLRYFPGSPRNFGRKLQEIKSDLEEKGLFVHRTRGKERMIFIKRVKTNDDNVVPSQEKNNAKIPNDVNNDDFFENAPSSITNPLESSQLRHHDINDVRPCDGGEKGCL